MLFDPILSLVGIYPEEKLSMLLKVHDGIKIV